MDVPGFSRVSGPLLDEEDERRATVARGLALYKAAEEAHRTEGMTMAALRRFGEAEDALAPILQSGLSCLSERELEAVLTGRLHQALIVAHLEELPDRWTKVKATTEEVLQYAFSNCHARWLRGLALLHGQGLRKEAEEEMRRALDYARVQGKAGEVGQWEAEIQQVFGGSEGGGAAAGPPAAAAEASAAAEQRPRSPRAASLTAASSSAPSAPSAPAVQKGFFNRRSPKVDAPESDTSKHAAARLDDAEVVSHARPLQPQRPKPQQPQEQQQKQPRSQPQQRPHQQQQEELLKLRRQVSDFERHREELLRKQEAWQQDLKVCLDVVGDDMEHLFTRERNSEGADPSSAVAARLRTSLAEVGSRLQEDRTWAEASHQKFLDLSTEVATLREMTTREAKERKDASKQQISELRELTKRIGDMKSTVKTVRDHTKLRAPLDGRQGEPDAQRLADALADFRALPAGTKAAAFLDDATVLSLLVAAAALGMLLALGVAVELFGRMRCRFVCAS